MVKKKNIFMMFTMALLLIVSLTFTGCYEGIEPPDDNTDDPLPEGYYSITIAQSTGGRINANKTSATQNEEVVLSYTENSGYTFTAFVVIDSTDILSPRRTVFRSTASR